MEEERKKQSKQCCPQKCKEVGRGHQMPWSWSYAWLWASMEMLGTEPRPLQGEPGCPPLCHLSSPLNRTLKRWRQKNLKISMWKVVAQGIFSKMRLPVRNFESEKKKKMSWVFRVWKEYCQLRLLQLTELLSFGSTGEMKTSLDRPKLRQLISARSGLHRKPSEYHRARWKDAGQ